MNSTIELFTPDTDFINDLIKVEQEAWDLGGENLEASADKITARLLAFKQGISIAMQGDSVAGSQYSFRLNWDGNPDSLQSWDEATADGWYHKTHLPNGNTGFLVGVGVLPEFRGKKFPHNLRWLAPMKVSELLIGRTLDNLFEQGVEQVIGNARIPGFHTKGELPLEEYCQLKRDDGTLYDPVLRFHVRMGAEILKPVPYSLEDPDSLNAGCWVIYKHKFHV